MVQLVMDGSRRRKDFEDSEEGDFETLQETELPAGRRRVRVRYLVQDDSHTSWTPCWKEGVCIAHDGSDVQVRFDEGSDEDNTAWLREGSDDLVWAPE